MAVTVTRAAPSAALPSDIQGARGVAGADTYVIDDTPFRNKRARLVKWTLSGTYATDGFALTPSHYGLVSIDALLIVGDTSGAVSGGAAVPVLTTRGASPVVKLFVAAGAELADTTSVADHVYTVLIVGS